MPWIDSTRPSKPFLSVIAGKDSAILYFQKGSPGDTLRGFAVYKTTGSFDADSSLLYRFIPFGDQPTLTLDPRELAHGQPVQYFVTAVSSTNNESVPEAVAPLSGQ
jgi:hypothetical protein